MIQLSISITDNDEARKVAYIKIKQDEIVAGTFSRTGEKDIHATYHANGHCHWKRKENGKLIEEKDLFEGNPLTNFKGKINFFNRLFATDFSGLPYGVSIPTNDEGDIRLQFKGGKLHLMSVFLIEDRRRDLLPDINKDEFVLYDKCSPWVLVTFFNPIEDKWNAKWNAIMKDLEQDQQFFYDVYHEGLVSKDSPLEITFWTPPCFDKKRDSVTLDIETKKP